MSLLDHSSLFASTIASSLRSRVSGGGSARRSGGEEVSSSTRGVVSPVSGVGGEDLEAGMGGFIHGAESEDGGGCAGGGEARPVSPVLLERWNEKGVARRRDEGVSLEFVTGDEILRASGEEKRDER